MVNTFQNEGVRDRIWNGNREVTLNDRREGLGNRVCLHTSTTNGHCFGDVDGIECPASAVIASFNAEFP